MGSMIMLLTLMVPVGLLMAVKPKAMWWVFSSWKYKDPKANEPSDAAYAMTAVGGVLMIVLMVALTVQVAKDERQDRALEAAQREARKPFVTPDPRSRGSLPIIGYTVGERAAEGPFAGKASYTVFYLRPDGATSNAIAAANPAMYPCVAHLRNREVGEERLSVDAELMWEPKARPLASEDEHCVNDRDGYWSVESSDLYFLADSTELRTNGPISDPSGRILLDAAPGNLIPRLTDPPTDSASAPHH